MADTLEEALLAAEAGETGDEEIRFVIDNDLRTIAVPNNFVLGVYNDKEVHRIPFEMPRYYKGIDLSEFNIQINYINAAGNGDVYFVEDGEAGEDRIEFSWLTARSVFVLNGVVAFIVCLRKSEGGVVTQEFNTTIARANVLTGIEVEPLDEDEAYDIIAHMREIETYVTRARSDVMNTANGAYQALRDANELISDADNALKYLTSMVGSPLVAKQAAEMTDTNKIYVYTGSETDYKKGYWYYYDGEAWQEGAIYDTSAVGEIIKVQPTEPDDDVTRIWVDDSNYEEFEVPTMDDFNEYKTTLDEAVNGFKNEVKTSLSTFSETADQIQEDFDKLESSLDTVDAIAKKMSEELPEAPSLDGSYSLRVTVSNGVPIYSWESI